MDALRIGFFVISAPRLYAALALLLLLLLAEVGAWQRRRRGAVGADTTWAWNALFGVVLGARLGFVLQNLGYYLTHPLQALAFWQGGFSPWWGVAGGAVVALLTLRRRGAHLGVMAVPGLVALAAWLVVPQLLSPAGGPPVQFPTGVLERLEGEALDFGTAVGSPTVINVWASWCIPCRREMPQLARAAQENPDVRVLYVNQGESPATVAAFLADHPAVDRGSVLLDSNQRVGNALRSVGLPSTYFFDAAGNHVKTHVGEISGPALTREIRALAAGSP